MKDKLIAAGVKNLKEFGYPSVTVENILTDMVYSAFFKTMLEGSKGRSKDVDKAVDELLAQIAEAK